MIEHHAAIDVLDAVEILQNARAACANLKPSGSRMSPQELEQRAKIIDTVIRTRKLLRQLQTSH